MEREAMKKMTGVYHKWDGRHFPEKVAVKVAPRAGQRD